MKVGILGLKQSGKTTVFNIVTGLSADKGFSQKNEANVGMAKVPDTRIDSLSKIFDPKKTIYASINYTDLPGDSSQTDSRVKYFQHVKDADILCIVTRAFENDAVIHSENSINPLRDLKKVESDLILHDMELAETRIERIEKGMKSVKKSDRNSIETDILKKILETLEQEKPLYTLEMTDEEQAAMTGYDFLTTRKVIVIVNTGENDGQRVPEQFNDIVSYSESKGYLIIPLCAQIEEEIAQLSEEEAELFREELGIKDASSDVLIRNSYLLAGNISFFTVGKDEVRAWTIVKDLSAKKASGKIHSDLEKGFIRAEIIAYDDFMAASCKTWQDAKNAKTFRLEGADYIIKDGDIMSVRFNV